jgi:cytidylate kinase
MGGYASQVSVIPEVRTRLSEMQQSYAASTSLVMDGRDIGTVIIPDAELKVFVDADIDIRGARRHQELLRRGQDVVLQGVIDDLRERDHRDRTRAVAPLKMAEDALLLDTSHLSIAEGIQQVLQWRIQRSA